MQEEDEKTSFFAFCERPNNIQELNVLRNYLTYVSVPIFRLIGQKVTNEHTTLYTYIELYTKGQNKNHFTSGIALKLNRNLLCAP